MLWPLAVAIVAVAFAWAGVAKLRYPETLFAAVALTGVSRTPTAAIRVWATSEVAIGVWLAISRSTAALATAEGVLVLLTVALAVSVRRGLESCGCFGPTETPASTALIRNAVLLAFIGTALALGRPIHTPAVFDVIAFATAVSLTACYLAIEGIPR